jgi:HEAT repeat protein
MTIADENRQKMRNFISKSQDMASASSTSGSDEWGLRTAADCSGLLLELARAERGFRFYSETDPRRRPLADRAHRALKSELGRAGALDLELGKSKPGFTVPGLATPIESTGPLLDLENSLRRRGIERLRLDPTLTRTALAGVLDLLGHDVSRRPTVADLAQKLAARDAQGIRINDLDTVQPEDTRSLASTPPTASTSIGAPIHTAAREDDRPGPTGAAGEKPELYSSPLRAAASDDRGERLRARLIELDATTEDDTYRYRVTDIVTWAEDCWNAELPDECYRAMLVLADHAVGCGGRSGGQARAASGSFATLASGDRLEALIERATDSGMAGVRAAQLLLQLGDIAVPSILNRLCEESDPNRAAPLRALILTQGEIALPAILDAIDRFDEPRARLGIQLAGEMQNPVVLPTLIQSLTTPDLGRRIETIRALSLLPGEKSKQALTDALASDLEEIAAEAGKALATTGGSEAVPALLDVLEASLHSSRTRLCCTLIEALGRIGDERVVPRLCAILERRPVLRRAHWHSIQLVTIDALAVLPTKEARRCIKRAARSATQSVGGRARDALQSLVEPKDLI